MMKRIINISLIFAIIGIIFVSAISAQTPMQKRRALRQEQATSTENTSSENQPNAQTPQNKNTNPPQPGLLGKPQSVAMERAMRELELTQDQIGKIRKIRLGFAAKSRDLIRLRRAYADVLDAAIFSENFDRVDVERKAKELANADAEIVKAQWQMMIDIRQELSAEQAKKLRQILEEEKARPLKLVQ
jgi:Spy/CpxP family protein refolding chaperone